MPLSLFNLELNLKLSQVLKKQAVFIVWLVLAALCVPEGPAFAVNLKNLSSVEVSVANESDSERNRAIRKGLAICLVRMSGHNTILQSQDISIVLDHASDYLLQFSYKTIEINHQDSSAEESYGYEEDYGGLEETPEGDEALTVEELPELKIKKIKRLTLKFDQKALLGVLTDAELPVWGSNRPEYLVWWVIEDQGLKSIFNPTGTSAAQGALKGYARARGVPIKFPLLDLQDKNHLALDDIWNLRTDQIEFASRRYAAKASLLGKTYFRDGKWYALWEVELQGLRKRYEASSPSIYGLNKLVMNTAANLMAGEYAVQGKGEKRKIILKVNEVKDLQNYAQLDIYLKKLVAIESAKLIENNGASVSYEVELKEGLEKLQKLIVLDNKMRRVISQGNTVQKLSADEGLVGEDTLNGASDNGVSAQANIDGDTPDTVKSGASDIFGNALESGFETEIELRPLVYEYIWLGKHVG